MNTEQAHGSVKTSHFFSSGVHLSKNQTLGLSRDWCIMLTLDEWTFHRTVSLQRTKVMCESLCAACICIHEWVYTPMIFISFPAKESSTWPSHGSAVPPDSLRFQKYYTAKPSTLDAWIIHREHDAHQQATRAQTAKLPGLPLNSAPDCGRKPNNTVWKESRVGEGKKLKNTFTFLNVGKSDHFSQLKHRTKEQGRGASQELTEHDNKHAIILAFFFAASQRWMVLDAGCWERKDI